MYTEIDSSLRFPPGSHNILYLPQARPSYNVTIRIQQPFDAVQRESVRLPLDRRSRLFHHRNAVKSKHHTQSLFVYTFLFFGWQHEKLRFIGPCLNFHWHCGKIDFLLLKCFFWNLMCDIWYDYSPIIETAWKINSTHKVFSWYTFLFFEWQHEKIRRIGSYLNFHWHSEEIDLCPCKWCFF